MWWMKDWCLEISNQKEEYSLNPWHGAKTMSGIVF